MPPNGGDRPVRVEELHPLGKIRLPAGKELGPIAANREISRREHSEIVKIVADVLRLHDRDGPTGQIRAEPIDTPVARTSGVVPDLLRVVQLKKGDNQVLKEIGGS